MVAVGGKGLERYEVIGLSSFLLYIKRFVRGVVIIWSNENNSLLNRLRIRLTRFKDFRLLLRLIVW